MIYNIDWLLMSAQMLATIYRDPTLLSFIFVSKKPLFELSNRFSLFRKRINEELSYNSQHLIFEYLLNKRFNNALAGIYIKSREVVVSDTYTYYKNEGQETIVMYTESEYTLDPTLTATYIYNDNEQDVTDFTVFVPTALLDVSVTSDVLSELRSVVEKYKFEGVNYTIQNY